MINWHSYPYSDLHEMNLDWVISTLKELDQRVDDIVADITERATENAIEAAKLYIDDQMAVVFSEFNDVKAVVADLGRDVNNISQQVIDLAGDLDDLEQDMIGRFNSAYEYIDGQIVAVNTRTDAAIEANNNYLLSTMETFLGNIKVLNYFTGEYVTIQDMFDYLCGLHVGNGIDYDTMNSRSLTYSHFNSLNITYTDFALNGNILYV